MRFTIIILFSIYLTACETEPSLKIATSSNMQFAMEELVETFEQESKIKVEFTSADSGVQYDCDTNPENILVTEETTSQEPSQEDEAEKQLQENVNAFEKKYISEKDYYDALDAEQMEQVNKCRAFIDPLEKIADTVHREIRLEIDLGTHKTFGTAGAGLSGDCSWLFDSFDLGLRVLRS